MKFHLIDMPEEQVLVKGAIDRLFTERAEIRYQAQRQEPLRKAFPQATFTGGIRWLIDALLADKIIRATTEIQGIVHKVAHGGEKFKEPTLIDDEVIWTLKGLYDLAPVHLPPTVEGIQVCRELLPGVDQYAVFETNFHQTLPPYAYLYGLPYAWYEEYGVRKYGFHGTSHRYAAETAAKILGRNLSRTKIVSCHLGSGTSVAAIKFGRSVDVSSGLTPQSGTIMSTRPGDFDPWVFPFIMEKTGLPTGKVNEMMVTQGGLLGISGLSGDMRDLEAAAAAGAERAELALEVFCYQVKKYIGAFVAAMNGLDVLVFTGGIGEKAWGIRSRICRDLDYLGIELDMAHNEQQPRPHLLSSESSRVQILAIDTDEELMIARQVYRQLNGR